MNRFRSLMVDVIIIVTIFSTIFYLYRNYNEMVVDYFFGEQKAGIFIRDILINVSIADSTEEREVGLSGISSLPPQEGKLFIFDEEGMYGLWMKNTLIPLDIMWIDENFKIVHIAFNVRPDSYPTIYNSPVPARFVLEVNAHFAETFRIAVGDQVRIPANKLPVDLQ